MSIDRFRPPDDTEPEVWAVCGECGMEIFPGDGYVEFDTMIYCDADCLAKAIGAEEKIAPDVF